MSTRRLPVYLLVDTSGSMKGEPIVAVNNGLGVLVGGLRQDPHALESVHLSLITFDREARLELELTSVDTVHLPEIQTPDSGPTHLGQALALLRERFTLEVVRSTDKQKGDWAPFLIVMTDGRPSDLQKFAEEVPLVRALGFASIIGCAAGPKASEEDLKGLCDHVVTLDTMDQASFSSLFAWVSSAVSGGNKSMGASTSIKLPPPPKEIQLVV
jgi:uncharacterized protein YegL